MYVHDSNPVHNLSLQQLRDLFGGTITDWSAVGGLAVRMCVHVGDVVLRDGERVHVVDHGSYTHIDEDAQTLAEFLGVPVWDVS